MNSPGVKNKISITISSDVKQRLEEIGSFYGLKISHMLERSARYYLAEFGDLEIALHRSQTEEEEIDLKEAEHRLGLAD